jgi:hypothetical protein
MVRHYIAGCWFQTSKPNDRPLRYHGRGRRSLRLGVQCGESTFTRFITRWKKERLKTPFRHPISVLNARHRDRCCKLIHPSCVPELRERAGSTVIHRIRGRIRGRIRDMDCVD